jgi:hypothetical protein
MSGACPEFDWFEGALRGELVSENQRRLWLEHVRQCRSCDAQWLAREELRKLPLSAPVPTLSSNFNDRLRLKLHNAPAPLPREARRWMQVYWLAAAVASVYILVRAEWLRRLLQYESFTLALLVLLAAGAFACFIQPRQIEQALAFLSILLAPEKPRAEGRNRAK